MNQQNNTQQVDIKSTVQNAIFDFAGFLTTRPGSISFGSAENATPMVQLIEEWLASRDLTLGIIKPNPTRFSKDMDGSMEPDENGEWVRHEDI